MYGLTLQQLGLTKNESNIYLALLSEGEANTGQIALKSGVHRRNVYDSLKRLVDRGLVFEKPSTKERIFQPLAPERLMRLLDTKENALNSVLPDLHSLYREHAHDQRVFIYRGPEGWKNYMRDMVRVADEAYFFAAKGGWLDDRVKHFFPYFIEEAKKRGIKYYHLFDQEIKTECPQILPHVGDQYRFFPEGYSTKAAIDVFGDYVFLIPDFEIRKLSDEIRLIVIVNSDVADAFRMWFKLMWELCPKNS